MKKKLIATAMLAIPVLGLFEGADVLAATRGVVSNVDVNGDSTQSTFPNNDVEVFIQQSSTFTVQIPKRIELTAQNSGGVNDTYASEYTVRITGNINASEEVSVEPDQNVILSQPGKQDLTATISQQEKTAAWDEITPTVAKELKGDITVQNVTAGNWIGNFNFNISLK